ncbi:MAG: chromosome partitioning protein [Cyclobacteriaceae bacterium]|jgi:chromosome partitioning protein
MIIAVVNQKGGTAKTTTTINLGVALAKQRKKVLLVDWDAQGNLTYSLGFQKLEKSISDVLHGDATLGETLLQSDGVHLLPSDITLADAEFAMADSEDRTSHLLNLLGDVVNNYDYIVIDCPPSMSILTLNALVAAQGVVIPLQPDVLSLQGLELIHQTIKKVVANYNSSLRVLGILPVMVDFRRKLTLEVLEHIDQNYDMNVFKSFIRTNVKASEAPSFGQSVISYAPKSNSAQDYLAFAKELLKLIK